MHRLLFSFGLLASLFAGELGHPLFQFTLEESPAQLAARFDRPPQLAAGPGHQVFQFHALVPTVIEAGLHTDWLASASSAACNGKYAYSAYFGADGKLVSILHQPDRRLPVSLFFPSGSFRSIDVSKPGSVTLHYKVRPLDAQRTLVAVFYSKDVKFIDQVLLIRTSHLPTAYPDLATFLK